MLLQAPGGIAGPEARGKFTTHPRERRLLLFNIQRRWPKADFIVGKWGAGFNLFARESGVSAAAQIWRLGRPVLFARMVAAARLEPLPVECFIGALPAR